jgi:hypothetical protein
MWRGECYQDQVSVVFKFTGLGFRTVVSQAGWLAVVPVVWTVTGEE